MNLKKIMIGDHCIVTSSKRFHLSERVEVGIPFYRSKEIIQKFNGEVVSECDYIPIEEYVNIKKQFGAPRVGDLLLTTRGTYGVPYVYKEKDCFYFADGNITWFKDFDEQLNSKYLYYWFQSYEGYQKVDAIAKGTAQKAVPITTLKQLELYTPIIDLQNKIVDILSAYDNLIENNQKQIMLLEEAAQRLYKEWFIDLRFPGHENVEIVDGTPVGWECLDFLKVAPIITGKKDANFGSENGKYLFFTCSQQPLLAKSYSYDCDAVILAGNGDFNVKLYRGKFEAYQRTYVLSPYKTEHLYLLFYTIKNRMNYLIQGASGSTIKFLTKGMIADIKVLVPTCEILNQYNEIAESLQRKLEVLIYQNKLLTEARDRLLPKLMSGEIEV